MTMMTSESLVEWRVCGANVIGLASEANHKRRLSVIPLASVQPSIAPFALQHRQDIPGGIFEPGYDGPFAAMNSFRVRC
jgi:hypothetical protein